MLMTWRQQMATTPLNRSRKQFSYKLRRQKPLYGKRMNLSNRQIAHELDLCESDVQAMVLRHGIVAKTPEVVLSGDVEFDELYVVAGHKGNPEAVRAKGRDGRRNRVKGGRGTLEKERPPI